MLSWEVFAGLLAQATASTNVINSLIADLGIVLVGAAVAILVCSRLKIPVIFGYLAAGALLGPNVFEPSFVTDLRTIQQLSDLGVIFLLFFIGLDFDLKKLHATLGPALIALIVQTAAMLYLAQLIAIPMGWDVTQSLFFGSLMAMSSSVVIIKVLRDAGTLNTPHAQLALILTIMEDILGVLLLVILTGVAVSRNLDWASVGLVSFLMGIFVVIVFVLGRLLAPRALARLGDDERSREAVTVVSLGLVMGLAAIAFRANFSPALGAFLGGAVLSQTGVARRIGEINRGLHDLFAAVFFVSIGMQLQPRLILGDWELVLGITVLMVVGKVLATSVGLILAGQSPRDSFLASVVKYPIAEFSFIIASLGQTLGVTDPRLTNLTFGVAFASILTVQPLYNLAPKMYDYAARLSPAFMRRGLSLYHDFLIAVQRSVGRNMVLKLIRRPVLQITLYFFLQNGIVICAFLASNLLKPREDDWVGWLIPTIWVGAAALSAPLVLAVVRNLTAIVYILTDALFEAHRPRPIFPRQVRLVVHYLLTALVIFLVGIIFLATAMPFLPATSVLLLSVCILALLAILGWRQLIRINSQMENLFMESFTSQVHDVARERREAFVQALRQKYPWPVQVQEIVLPEASQAVGRRVRELNLRANTGASIIGLGRGGRQVLDPGADTPLFADDHLFLLGTPEQLAAAELALNQPSQTPAAADQGPLFTIDSALVEAGGPLADITLAGAGFRQRYGVTVVGIQRGEERITSPRPDTVLLVGDIVYVVGSPDCIKRFTQRVAHEAKPLLGEVEVL